MKIRIVMLVATAMLLSACTDQDWQHALTYAGVGGSHQNDPQTRPVATAQPQATTQPAPIAQSAPMTAQATPPTAPPAQTAPPPNAFCESVASQDARGNDFDSATERRVFVQSYQQCVAVFGSVTQ
ncbi:MAG TPA: hypothetical protein VKB67_00420 [Rhizomicrobium sp.]|nr:hypothetical protein [Rhizomicrobium sp.]